MWVILAAILDFKDGDLGKRVFGLTFPLIDLKTEKNLKENQFNQWGQAYNVNPVTNF